MKEPRIIKLPKLESDRGNLSIIEGHAQIPFNIRRVAWIYDVPGGEQRGAHAYRCTQEFIVALSGSFDVVLHDGTRQQTFPLNRSYYGLYVPQGWWRMMNNFSTNAVALVVASTDYDENDYIWDFDEFKAWREAQ